MCFYHFIALVSILCYLELICILCCELCECKTFGFLLCMVEPILLCYGYIDVYLHLYAQGMVFISRLNLLCDMSCLCFVSFTYHVTLLWNLFLYMCAFAFQSE